ncbi:MAG: cation transporter [Erysipelotrichaceae bacterium]|nr:cation transporter [Erysipelotrichaceae bacterium]
MDKYEQVAMKVSTISIIVNVVLSAVKFLAGLIAHSQAMISDAVHSLSDVLSTLVVMVGIHISQRQSDDDHPYGHERLESVASVLLAVLLAMAGAGIAISGYRNMNTVTVPGTFALVAAILSIVVKEWMFQYTAKYAKEINSGALMADAWHHRSDSLSSIGALIGIAGAKMGYPIMDTLASMVISVFIVKAAYDIFMQAISQLVDHAVDDETQENIRNLVRANENVKNIDSMRTRMFGSKIYVDLELAVEGTLTVKEGHAIAESVHDAIESTFANVKHCMIHIQPYEEK